MEDINEYWKMMDYPPIFTNIDWNEPLNTQQVQGQSNNNFIPMEYDNQKIPSYQHPPFQRRRSSSVDLPINPLYSNTNRFMMNHVHNEPTIVEEDFVMPVAPPTTTTRMNRIGSSATLEFPGDFSTHHNNNNNFYYHQFMNMNAESPLSTASSDNNMMSPPQQQQQVVTQPAPQQQQQPAPQQQQPAPQQQSAPQQASQQQTPPPQQQSDGQQTITFFPELHRTSYNTILGKQLKQHQKRRRSSSLPPAFHQRSKQQHVPTPLIFTQIQVTDPTPVHHTQKAAKVDTRPVAIERAPKKPQPKPVTCDPIQTQKKLDEQLLQLNFEDVTVAELKEMLRERGLPATGKKAILTDRLKDARDLLVKQKSASWLLAPVKDKCDPSKDNKAFSVSPNIQGMANMTINSPIPPTQSLFMPIEGESNQQSNSSNLFHDLDHTSVHPGVPINNNTKQASVSPNQPLESYHYGDSISLGGHEDELDMNDLFNFDTNTTMLDFNSNNNNNHGWDHLVNNTTEWDQDKLDFFLKELV